MREWAKRNELRIAVTTLLFLLIVGFLAPNIFIPIMPGQCGVQWSRFLGGTKTDKVYREGIHIIFPWNRMYIYNVRLQQRSKTFHVLSEDGLSMDVEIVIRFKLREETLGYLHKYVGPDYVDVLVLPEIAARGRDIISSYEPAELYTQRRVAIQRQILDDVRNELRIRDLPRRAPTDFIYIEDVLIRNIVLPPQVAEAIRNKLVQQQIMLEYDYRLLREEKERQRKTIEAEGIRQFQDIVSEGISERYLKWKGIDATLELARSQNSKIVIIGSGQGGLPIILGNLDATASPEAGSRGAAAGRAAVQAAEGALGRRTSPASPTPAPGPAAGAPPPNPNHP
jgi:regulator of protease activity HflC (stomatin/prohibitin superfamily)